MTHQEWRIADILLSFRQTASRQIGGNRTCDGIRENAVSVTGLPTGSAGEARMRFGGSDCVVLAPTDNGENDSEDIYAAAG